MRSRAIPVADDSVLQLCFKSFYGIMFLWVVVFFFLLIIRFCLTQIMQSYPYLLLI